MSPRYTLAILALAAVLTTEAAVGQWRCYQSYAQPMEISQAGGDVFVLASGGLYTYSKADKAIRTFDRTSGLSATEMTHIAWCQAARRLVAVYQDSHIDLITADGNVTQLPDLATKTMVEDKTIQQIYIHGTDAYLATGFGIVRVDVPRAEISETYNLGRNVPQIAIADGELLCNVSDGILAAPLTANLIDRSVWKLRTDGDYTVFRTDTTAWHDNIATVRTLSPGGPADNRFGFLRFTDGKLYTAGSSQNDELPACLQVWDGRDWQIYDTTPDGQKPISIMTLDVDPNDTEHIYAGAQNGLWEYHGGRLVKHYDHNNSPLKPACVVPQTVWDNYTMVTSVSFAPDGTLYMANSLGENNSLFALSPAGTWTAHHSDKLCNTWTSGTTGASVRGAYQNLTDLTFDQRGALWTVNDNWAIPVIGIYKDGGFAVYSSFANQDAAPLAPVWLRRFKEDRDGNLWFGSSIGPLMLPAEEINYAPGPALTLTQVKIPRDDGSGLADYLLADIPASAIAIDGSNRKWIGTYGAGLYLISPDGTQQIAHYTAENSLLLSDDIKDIAINDNTGEVFIATSKGLCSYLSDATAPAETMTKETVIAYPNPVPPGYTGLITITGLTFDADVKILTATGALVRAGRSNGGTFTWDGRDEKGRRVASGVYNVATATQDGGKGTVCKLAVVN